MKDNLLYSLIGMGISAFVAILGKKLDLWRFKNKDKADTEKLLSTAALDWTVQLAGQLEKANIVIEKRQAEIEKLHDTIDTMKKEFEIVVQGFHRRIHELETALDNTIDELKQERLINQEEMEKIKKANGTK